MRIHHTLFLTMGTLIAIATVPLLGQAGPSEEPPFTTSSPPSRTIWVLPSSPSKSTATPPAKVLVEGFPAPVLDQRPVGDTPWQILVTVDLPLVRPASLEAFSQWMAARAERLAALGSVSITLRGTGRSTLLEASRDAQEIASALVELGREAERAGEYFADRQTTLSKLAKTSTDEQRRRVLIDHFHQEQKLLEWQHHSLVDDLLIENRPHWMQATSGRSTPPPQAAFLLRDDLGATTLAFLEHALDGLADRSHGTQLNKSDVASQVRRLSQRLKATALDTEDALSGATRVFSASGYALFPVALAPIPASMGRLSMGQGRRILQDATASKLASGSGLVVTSQSSLDQALGILGAAMAIEFSAQSLGPVNADRTGEILAVNISSVFRGDGARSFWVSTAPPRALTLARARRFFDGSENGPLSVQAGLLGELAGGATLETALQVKSLFPATSASHVQPTATSDRLRVSVVQRRLDHALEVEQIYGDHQPLDKKRWLLRSSVRLPRDLDAVAVLVEDLVTGRWGAAMAEEIQDSLESSTNLADVRVEDAATPLAGVETHRARRAGTAISEAQRNPKSLVGEPSRRTSTRFKPPVLQIVAPARDRLTGEQKFAVLLSTNSVRSVVFYLDDEEIERDDRAPFAATLQLGPTASEHSIRAVGFSSSGLLLGTDEVSINRPLNSQGLKITSLRRKQSEIRDSANNNDSPSTLEVEAALRLAPNTTLDRVEFYRNQSLLATMTTTPLRASVGAPPTADAAARGDFVRVVAWLTDGSFVEDVRLLGLGSDGGLGDFGTQVQVNLVQVFTVVNDSAGNPIEGLSAADFTLELAGKPLSVERFSEAERVPLDLALVVDSSESMWALMDDTRKAAARFLGDTLTEDDRALVIDFDNSVRLVHPLSGEVFALIQSLSKLKASGATALYDSIIFALVNLEDAASSRRAVVLLTDGDDFNSRFSYRRVYESARFAGVPLYFLALSDFFGDQRRGVRKTDLESFAEASGGRVFYVKSMEEILAAYQRISRELRSQYLLTFATEESLSREQLEKVVVKVRRGGKAGGGGVKGKVDVRWTVGGNR